MWTSGFLPLATGSFIVLSRARPLFELESWASKKSKTTLQRNLQIHFFYFIQMNSNSWVTLYCGFGSYTKFQVNSSDILVLDQACLGCSQLEAISDSLCFPLDSCLITCWQVIFIVQWWNHRYRKEDLQGDKDLGRSSCVTEGFPGSDKWLSVKSSWSTALTSMPHGGRGGSVWRLTNVSACSTFKSTKPVASWLHIWLFSFELRKKSFGSSMLVASYAPKKIFCAT